MRRIILAAMAGVAAVAVTAGCGNVAVHGAAAPSQSKPVAAPSSLALTADKAVCKQFTDDSNTSQVLDETEIVALLGQYPAVSSALARDYQAVGNTTTVHTGLIAQINMAADCAVVGIGRIPDTTWPPGA
jgi:uncharacterized protein YycO